MIVFHRLARTESPVHIVDDSDDSIERCFALESPPRYETQSSDIP
jgi:hypothetical protein